MRGDHALDAMEYAIRQPRRKCLRGWRKALRWLASRPLDRVRYKRHFVRANFLVPSSPLGEEIKALYNKALLSSSRDYFVHLDRAVDEAKRMEWRRSGIPDETQP